MIPIAPTAESLRAYAEVQLKLLLAEHASLAVRIELQGDLEWRQQVQPLREKLRQAEARLRGLGTALAEAVARPQLELEPFML